MRGLLALQRLARMEIDARMRTLAAIMQSQLALDTEDAALDAALADERRVLRGNPELGAAFGAFQARIQRQREALARRRRQLEADEDSARAALIEAHLEAKRFTTLVDNSQQRAAAAAARTAAQALDAHAARRAYDEPG